MSESNTSSSSRGGIGFAGLLTILFIGLKLGGVGAVATWSWWWVLSPLWIGLALWLAVVFLIFFFGLLVAIVRR